MSQADVTVTEKDVVQFVAENTTPTAKWCPREEIVWVLSWYGNREESTVLDALNRSVSEGRLIARSGEYTVPELL